MVIQRAALASVVRDPWSVAKKDYCHFSVTLIKETRMKLKGTQERTGFENLRVYGLAEEIADLVWEIVIKWDRLPQDTVGKQLIKSADSIGANIAEGTGRGSFADNRRFARIARGSLFELKHWLRRSFKRELLTQKEITSLLALVQQLTPKLSAYISSIGKKSTSSK